MSGSSSSPDSVQTIHTRMPTRLAGRPVVLDDGDGTSAAAAAGSQQQDPGAAPAPGSTTQQQRPQPTAVRTTSSSGSAPRPTTGSGRGRPPSQVGAELPVCIHNATFQLCSMSMP